MHTWKKKLVVSQLALACTLAITSQANASTDISGTTYTTFIVCSIVLVLLSAKGEYRWQR